MLAVWDKARFAEREITDRKVLSQHGYRGGQQTQYNSFTRILKTIHIMERGRFHQVLGDETPGLKSSHSPLPSGPRRYRLARSSVTAPPPLSFASSTGLLPYDERLSDRSDNSGSCSATHFALQGKPPPRVATTAPHEQPPGKSIAIEILLLPCDLRDAVSCPRR
jgi:hypothetical protein